LSSLLMGQWRKGLDMVWTIFASHILSPFTGRTNLSSSSALEPQLSLGCWEAQVDVVYQQFQPTL
jgi:hypothetical protein